MTRPTTILEVLKAATRYALAGVMIALLSPVLLIEGCCFLCDKIYRWAFDDNQAAPP